jgi:hypothetical protein
MKLTACHPNAPGIHSRRFRIEFHGEFAAERGKIIEHIGA